MPAVITNVTAGVYPLNSTGSAVPTTAYYIAARDNSGNLSGLVTGSATNDAYSGSGSLLTSPLLYNGSTFDRQRTPTTRKTVAATASGNTALWTPASGKKFRLMRFEVQVSGNGVIAGGGIVTVTFQDATTDLGIANDFYLPAVAVTTTPGELRSGWIDIGNGVLSALANNVLNVNLSAALTTGQVRVTCVGTEE